jgi:hypothetical protein
MILLEIDSSSLSLVILKRDAPRPVHVNRVTRRFVPTQSMEIKAREIEVRRLRRRIESVKHQQRTCLKILSNSAASPFFEQLAKALVNPPSNHIFNVYSRLSFVNYKLTNDNMIRGRAGVNPAPLQSSELEVRAGTIPVLAKKCRPSKP